MGVESALRSQAIGRKLYERFLVLASKDGRTEVEAITNAINTNSIAFNRRLGFEVSEAVEATRKPSPRVSEHVDKRIGDRFAQVFDERDPSMLMVRSSLDD